MRKIAILFVALIVVLGSCKKDDDGPKFTSAAGDWTYTTPDGKIKVDFTIGVTDITSATITVDGVAAKSVVQYDGINPPAIEHIRINADDTKVTYPFPIEFNNGTVNSDFTQITVPSASYTWPHDKTNTLTNITITRK